MLVTRFPYRLAGNYIGDVSTIVSISKGRNSDTYSENSFGIRHPLPANKLAQFTSDDYQKLVSKCKQSLATKALDEYQDPIDDIAVYNVHFSLSALRLPGKANSVRYYLAGGGTVINAVSH